MCHIMLLFRCCQLEIKQGLKNLKINVMSQNLHEWQWSTAAVDNEETKYVINKTKLFHKSVEYVDIDKNQVLLTAGAVTYYHLTQI